MPVSADNKSVLHCSTEYLAAHAGLDLLCICHCMQIHAAYFWTVLWIAFADSSAYPCLMVLTHVLVAFIRRQRWPGKHASIKFVCGHVSMWQNFMISKQLYILTSWAETSTWCPCIQEHSMFRMCQAMTAPSLEQPGLASIPTCMLEEALLKYMFASLYLTSHPRQQTDDLFCADYAQLQPASYST